MCPSTLTCQLFVFAVVVIIAVVAAVVVIKFGHTWRPGCVRKDQKKWTCSGDFSGCVTPCFCDRYIRNKIGEE